MSEYFLNPIFLEANLKDLSNYAIKIDLKNVTEVYTSSFAKKIDLANLKSNVDKLDIDQFGKVPTGPNSLKKTEDKWEFNKKAPNLAHLIQLSDVLTHNVLKKDVYNDIEDKIPNIINLATNTTDKAKN